MDENKMTELNKAIENIWDSLTDEQRVAAKNCKSMDELAALAGEAGIELPEEILSAVAGGTMFRKDCENKHCPYCNTTHIFDTFDRSTDSWRCNQHVKWFKIVNGKYYGEDGNCLGDYVAPSKKGC